MSSEATPLNLKNVGGVFWVTIYGSLLSLVLVFIEMGLHLLKRCLKTKTPFTKLVVEELKFYFKFSGMVKPVIRESSAEDDQKSEESPAPYGFIVDT